MERHAPAKINLGLHVLRKRSDGYHDLETVFLRIGWADQLTARPAEDFRLTCSDPTLPVDEGNLCTRAAALLRARYGVTRGAALHLEKRLPYGAGLGGGSSDAAAALRLLAELWALPAREEELAAIAAQLGSDVPFFLHPAPAAYATGRGEVLSPLLDEAGQPYRFPFGLVVVMPPFHVSTAEAYRAIRPRETNRPDLRAAVRSNDLARWRAELQNDFEVPVFARHPEIRQVRDALLRLGAGYAALSGSGAAVFGVFEEAEAGRRAAAWAEEQGYRAWRG